MPQPQSHDANYVLMEFHMNYPQFNVFHEE